MKMRNHWKTLSGALGCLLIFAGVASAQSVNVDSFENGLRAPGVQIFDVRTPEEYNSGHLAGSLLANFNNKEEFNHRVKYLDKQKPVYIYCLSGGRSSAAAKWMRENGFREVVEMDGGIRAWKEAGKPLEGAKEEKQLSIDAFRQSIQKGLVLVDVGAAWCPPCRTMEPVLQQFMKQHPQVQLVQVDGGKDQEVMQSINARELPSFILYKNGKEQWRKQGVATLEELEQAVKKLN
jgi:rhodanese-related sulfurtransferase